MHIIITTYEAPANCRYMTLAETLMSNSERHYNRAQHWLIAGKPEYAMDCLYKAARNEDRARRLELL